MSGNDDEDVKRPRDILVADYVKERIVQIAELLEATDNSSLIGGEVTKGPRTAVQRLPRNLRRRAMSYNIKRFPRNQRRFASAVIAASKHRKKPPSRFWRRRPRNLLMNYVRRQRKLVWLETHVWHAKRFRMVSRWGYRLPFYSWQRAFRPSYRDSMRHCAVHDVSYMRCFQISTSNQRSLIEKLRCLCQPSASATFAFKAALNGRMETPVLLYEPSEYPSGFIGPARFLWCRPK
ncbi:hypothetical protein AB6A40_004099 [Gnathostoma spinigerum]|uniref:Pop1 N-terminal domain-containing protein n=1 Tax=Gnathostoma spinigerum TaxID=75299 RepID=A0ABD6EBH4_9BILA